MNDGLTNGCQLNGCDIHQMIERMDYGNCSGNNSDY